MIDVGTIAQLEERLGSEDCWVLAVVSDGCSACKDFKPHYEEAARRAPAHAKFFMSTTGKNPEIAGAVGVQYVPTVFVKRDGVVRVVKARHANEILKLL